MLDFLASLAAGWLGPVASALARGSGLLAIVAVILIAWLARQAAVTLAGRLGVDPETMLIVAVLAAAWLSLRFASRPPPEAARAAREAREIQEWRQDSLPPPPLPEPGNGNQHGHDGGPDRGQLTGRSR